MPRMYQLIEKNPDEKVLLGDIDEDGDRVIWFSAWSREECRRWLIKNYPTIDRSEDITEQGWCYEDTSGIDAEVLHA